MKIKVSKMGKVNEWYNTEDLPTTVEIIQNYSLSIMSARSYLKMKPI